jgi:hypothetical protein
LIVVGGGFGVGGRGTLRGGVDIPQNRGGMHYEE